MEWTINVVINEDLSVYNVYTDGLGVEELFMVTGFNPKEEVVDSSDTTTLLAAVVNYFKSGDAVLKEGGVYEINGHEFIIIETVRQGSISYHRPEKKYLQVVWTDSMDESHHRPTLN